MVRNRKESAVIPLLREPNLEIFTDVIMTLDYAKKIIKVIEDQTG